MIKNRNPRIIFQTCYQISSEFYSSICMEKLGACITRVTHLICPLCFQYIFRYFKRFYNFSSRICLKFYSKIDRSLNSSIIYRKSSTIFILSITVFRFERVAFQDFRATLRFLNLAVKILAASMIWTGAVRCCWTTL